MCYANFATISTNSCMAENLQRLVPKVVYLKLCNDWYQKLVHHMGKTWGNFQHETTLVGANSATISTERCVASNTKRLVRKGL